MRKKIIIASIAIGIVLIGFVVQRLFISMKQQVKEENIVEAEKFVETEIIQLQDYNANVSVYGRLKTTNKIEIYSEVSGTIIQTNPPFKVGSRFSEGSTLFKIEDEETKLNLYAQKSDFLNILTKMLPDLKSDFPESFQKWNDYLESYQIENGTKPLPEASNSREKYFLAARNIYKFYYTIKTLELRISKQLIKAPFSGFATLSTVDPGAIVRIGQKLGEFTGTNNYELELSVNVDDAMFINIGNNVRISSKENNMFWTGRIVRISNTIDPSTQTLKLFATVNGSNLKDGMYLLAEIEGNPIRNVVKLPRKAIVNNNFVYIIRNGILDTMNVNIVSLGDKYAYINNAIPSTEVVVESLVEPKIGSKVKSTNK